MGITTLVFHYLITTHHGSHYDWHVWDNWYLYIQSHGYVAPSKAVRRVLILLAKGGI
jgi:hypothetical protein